MGIKPDLLVGKQKAIFAIAKYLKEFLDMMRHVDDKSERHMGVREGIFRCVELVEGLEIDDIQKLLDDNWKFTEDTNV